MISRKNVLFFLGIYVFITIMKWPLLVHEIVWETVYISGRLIYEGLLPYKDFWSYYTPLFHYIHAVFYAIAGTNLRGAIMLESLYMLGTLIAFFALAKELFKKPAIPYLLTTLFAFIAHTRVLYWIGFEAEVYTLLPICLSLYWYFRYTQTYALKNLCMAGAFSSLSILIKHPTGLTLVFYGLFTIGLFIIDKKSVKTLLKHLSLFSIAALLPGLIVILHAHFTGYLIPMVSQIYESYLYTKELMGYFWDTYLTYLNVAFKTLPIGFLSICAGVLILKKKLPIDRMMGLLIGFIITSLLQVMAHHAAAGYYFLQLYMGLTLFCGYYLISYHKTTKKSQHLVIIGFSLTVLLSLTTNSITFSNFIKATLYNTHKLDQTYASLSHVIQRSRRLNAQISSLIPSGKKVQFVSNWIDSGKLLVENPHSIVYASQSGPILIYHLAPEKDVYRSPDYFVINSELLKPHYKPQSFYDLPKPPSLINYTYISEIEGFSIFEKLKD